MIKGYRRDTGIVFPDSIPNGVDYTLVTWTPVKTPSWNSFSDVILTSLLNRRDSTEARLQVFFCESQFDPNLRRDLILSLVTGTQLKLWLSINWLWLELHTWFWLGCKNAKC